MTPARPMRVTTQGDRPMGALRSANLAKISDRDSLSGGSDQLRTYDRVVRLQTVRFDGHAREAHPVPLSAPPLTIDRESQA
jgi:hypothetical protein